MLKKIMFGLVGFMFLLDVAGGSAAAGVDSRGILWGIIIFAAIVIGGLGFAGNRARVANEQRIQEIKTRAAVIEVRAALVLAVIVASTLFANPEGTGPANAVVNAISGLAHLIFR